MLIRSAAQFVDYMTERLSPSEDPNAPQKMIREFYVVKLRDFFSTLKDRNITGNATLDQLAEQGVAILDGVDIKTLRKSDKTRDEIKAKFDALKPMLDNAITDKPKRRLKFDLDTDACPN